jgi:hypothetical protein
MELLVLSVACLPFLRSWGSPASVAAALILHPTRSLLSRHGVVGGNSKPSMRQCSHLKTRQSGNADDDFAAFGDFGPGGDDGQQLAREFYQELEFRHSEPPQMTPNDGDETYSLRDPLSRGPSNEGQGSKNTIRAVRIRADGNGPSAPSRFTNQPKASPSQESSAVAFPMLPFLSFPSPAPRPAASAGLFSGSGTTVYSSGRSIRAEMEILETTIKNNEAKNNKLGWDGVYAMDAEQLEEALRLAVLALVVVSAAYVAIEASGGISVVTWDGAAASANHVLSLMNDATHDGISSIKISVNDADVFLGEEAAWLVKESSHLAASVVEAVRSVEELVLT